VHIGTVTFGYQWYEYLCIEPGRCILEL